MYARLGIEVSLVGDSLKALIKKLYPLNSKLILGLSNVRYTWDGSVSIWGLTESTVQEFYPLDFKLI